MDGIPDSVDKSLSKLWEIVKEGKPGVLQSKGSQRVGHNIATDQQNKARRVGCISTKIDQYPTLCGISDLKGTERLQD